MRKGDIAGATVGHGIDGEAIKKRNIEQTIQS